MKKNNLTLTCWKFCWKWNNKYKIIVSKYPGKNQFIKLASWWRHWDVVV